MPQQRVRGQESIVTILKDGQLQARIDSIKDAEVTFDLEIQGEGFLGETADRFDAIFKGMTVKISGQMTNGQLFDLAEAVILRAQRAGGVSRVDMAVTLVFPGGDLVTIAIPDLQFGSIPIAVGCREEFVTFALEAQGSEFQRL